MQICCTQQTAGTKHLKVHCLVDILCQLVFLFDMRFFALSGIALMADIWECFALAVAIGL